MARTRNVNSDELARIKHPVCVSYKLYMWERDYSGEDITASPDSEYPSV